MLVEPYKPEEPSIPNDRSYGVNQATEGNRMYADDDYQEPPPRKKRERIQVKKRKMRLGLPLDIDQYILWLLTPKILLILDIYLLFLKIYFIFVEQFVKPDSLTGSLVVLAPFAFKLMIPPCFLCGKVKSQIYYTNACYIVRVIFDILIIVPLTIFMTIIGEVHWATIAIVIGILLIANLITCCFCVWDSYRFIDKYETEYTEEEGEERKLRKPERRIPRSHSRERPLNEY